MQSRFKRPQFGLRPVQLALLFTLLLFSRAAFAGAYSCGNGSSNHCYGQYGWAEQPQYFGAYTDILQSAMNCPSGCGGFLTNEIWLADNQTSACVSGQYGACWVETGFQANEGDGNPYYFWADVRPSHPNDFHTHFYSQADVADFAHFMIIEDSRGVFGAGIYQVWIYNDSILFNGISTSNDMVANVIQVGSELAGGNGASGTALFSREIWAVKPLEKDFTFWYRSQTDFPPIEEIDPPQSARWLITPLHPPPEGGEFLTTVSPTGSLPPGVLPLNKPPQKKQ